MKIILKFLLFFLVEKFFWVQDNILLHTKLTLWTCCFVIIWLMESTTRITYSCVSNRWWCLDSSCVLALCQKHFVHIYHHQCQHNKNNAIYKLRFEAHEIRFWRWVLLECEFSIMCPFKWQFNDWKKICHFATLKKGTIQMPKSTVFDCSLSFSH